MSGTVFGKIAGVGRPRRQELTDDGREGQRRSTNFPRPRSRKDRGGEATCEAVVRDCLARRRARRCRQSVRQFRSRTCAGAGARARSRAARGPLHGVPIGVKDTIDTFDMPTEMGSPIYRGHRPRGGCRLRRAVAPRRRGDPRQDCDLRIRRQRAAGNHQPAQCRAHAGRLVERLGGSGRRSHGAGGARHPDRRLGAAAVVVLRDFRLQADLQHLQQSRRVAGGGLASTRSAGSRASIDDIALL
jgi:hypothetical protein